MPTRQKKVLGFVFSIAFVFAMSGVASAISIDNASFETGDFTGWGLSYGNGGSASVKTMTTASTQGSGTSYSATDGSYFAEIEATAYISQDLTWGDGDHIFFDWAFLAFDYKPYDDYSVFELKNETGKILDSVKLSSVKSVGNYGDTGWNTFKYIFDSAGSGSINFGSINKKDNAMDSKLLVDNVHTPEPATIALLGIGLAGLAGAAARRRRKRKATS